MDIEHIKALISDLDINDIAFEDTRFAISELPPMDGQRCLGCYFPDENLIVIEPEVTREAVVIHEIGHKFCDYHFHDISERCAEMFREYIMGE